MRSPQRVRAVYRSKTEKETDLVDDRLTVAVRTLRAARRKVVPEIAIKGAGLECHIDRAFVLARLKAIDEDLK